MKRFQLLSDINFCRVLLVQCSFSVCLKTREENQRAVDEFADHWRVRAADSASGDPADPFDCFYDVSDPRRVIRHKTYSRADVVHSMLWPSLVVVASAITFLYLEARRSRLTFCGKRPSEAADGEKAVLKPASSSSSSSQHANKFARQQEHAVNDSDRHHHGIKPVGSQSKVPDQQGPRQKDGRHLSSAADRLNGKVHSSIDVSLSGTSPNTVLEGPASRRARRRSRDQRTLTHKSLSASSITFDVDTAVLGRPASTDEGRRAVSGQRPMSGASNDENLVGVLDPTTAGRCVSESRLDTAI